MAGDGAVGARGGPGGRVGRRACCCGHATAACVRPGRRARARTARPRRRRARPGVRRDAGPDLHHLLRALPARARPCSSRWPSSTDGLHHVELDVTNQPEVAQSLSVLRTPTTIALAPDGRELLRVGGVPKGSLDCWPAPHRAPDPPPAFALAHGTPKDELGVELSQLRESSQGMNVVPTLRELWVPSHP